MRCVACSILSLKFKIFLVPNITLACMITSTITSNGETCLGGPGNKQGSNLKLKTQLKTQGRFSTQHPRKDVLVHHTCLPVSVICPPLRKLPSAPPVICLLIIVCRHMDPKADYCQTEFSAEYSIYVCNYFINLFCKADFLHLHCIFCN
jgi:hypothetical protein